MCLAAILALPVESVVRESLSVLSDTNALTFDVVETKLINHEISLKLQGEPSTSINSVTSPKNGFCSHKLRNGKSRLKAQCFVCTPSAKDMACRDCQKTTEPRHYSKHNPMCSLAKQGEANFLVSDWQQEINLVNQGYGGNKESQHYTFALWTPDSGATSHCVNNTTSKNLQSFIPREVKLSCANQTSLLSLGSGNYNSQIKSVLNCPDISQNLLSIGKLCDMNGSHALFTPTSVYIYNPEQAGNFIPTKTSISMEGARNGQLWQIKTMSNNSAPILLVDKEKVSRTQLWHYRINHINIKSLFQLQKVSHGIKLDTADIPSCPCILGKSHRGSFKSSDTIPSRLGQYVSSDVVGMFDVTTYDGFKYFVTFIDHWSRYTVLYLLKRKSDVFEAFSNYAAKIHAKTGRHIEIFRTDGGGEYINHSMAALLSKNGTTHQITQKAAPESNGISERYNRVINEGSISKLAVTGLPKYLQGEAALATNYEKNRSPHSWLADGLTPYEKWEGKPPNMLNLRIWGTTAYGHIPKQDRRKHDFKARPLIHVGYSTTTKSGWRLFDTSPKGNKRLIITAHATFINEEQLAMKFYQDTARINKQSPVLPISTSNQFELLEDVDDLDNVTPTEPVENPPSTANPSFQYEIITENNSTPPTRGEINPDNIRPSSLRSGGEYKTAQINHVVPKGRRAKSFHVQFKEWEDNLPVFSGQVNLAWDNISTETFISGLQGADDLIRESLLLTYAQEEPLTYRQAMSSSEATKWKEASDTEMSAFQSSSVFDLVDLPHGSKALRTKWVFKKKRNADGTILKYKARLCVQGQHQKQGVDFTETYAPVASYDSFRILLSIAAQEDLEIQNIDVTTAFLLASMDGEVPVYIEQPLGYISTGNEGKVWRLKKSVYGLKQAPRLWNTLLDEKLRLLGFNPTISDPCVYIGYLDNEKLLIAVYVDDLIIASKHVKTISSFKSAFEKYFPITDLGDLKFVLNIEVIRDRPNRRIFLSQTSKLQGIIDDARLSDAKIEPLPSDPSLPLTKEMSPQSPEETAAMLQTPYREFVGRLLYIALSTRPDISQAVSSVGRYAANPGPLHWNAVKNIIKYLKGTKDFCLVLGGKSEGVTIQGYSDSDWGADTDRRLSRTGSIIQIGIGPVMYQSKMQQTVAHSSTEAEYMALSTTARNAAWARSLLDEMGYHQPKPTTIYEDNTSTIHLANNSKINSRTKHIDIRHHALRDMIRLKTISLVYIPTTDQVADILTKQLKKPQFQFLRSKLGVLQLSLSDKCQLRGDVGISQ
jgi:hypothetical protein